MSVYNHFEVKRAHGHLWLLYRGVVIWRLDRDGRHSTLMQVAPSTAESMREAG